MILGLDFDNTITADPNFWAQFVLLARSNQHRVTIVTNREGPNDDVEAFAKRVGIDVIYAGDEYKAAAAYAAGKHVQVWIDDTPTTIQEVFLLCPDCGTCMQPSDEKLYYLVDYAAKRVLELGPEGHHIFHALSMCGSINIPWGNDWQPTDQMVDAIHALEAATDGPITDVTEPPTPPAVDLVLGESGPVRQRSDWLLPNGCIRAGWTVIGCG